MRKTFPILFIFVFASNILFSQVIRFNKRYDIAGSWDVSRCIIEVKNGYIITGGTDPYYIFNMLIDSIGNKIWVKNYQIPNWPYAAIGFAGSVIKTTNNNIAICGGVKDNNDIDNSLLFLINENGDTLWTKTYNTSNKDNTGYQCKQATDKGFIICGDISISNPTNFGDFLLIKTDSNGVMQWWNNYGDNKIEMAYNVTQTPDKGYLIGGIHFYNIAMNFHEDPKIVKTDSMGNFKWDKLMGGPFSDDPAMVCVAKDSNYIVAYTIAEYENEGDAYRKINVNKLDTSGNIIWSKKYGPTYKNNNLIQIKLVPDGGFLISGYTDHPLFDFYQVGWLLRINANGDSLWYREYANYVQYDMMNQLHDFYLTKDKGIVATGPLYPNQTGGTQDIWVIKTDSVGCLEDNCDGVKLTEITKSNELHIYPNPVHDKITIKLQDNEAIIGSIISIYNMEGQILMQKKCLQKETEIDVKQLMQGLYILKVSLRDGSYLQQRFVVVK